MSENTQVTPDLADAYIPIGGAMNDKQVAEQLIHVATTTSNAQRRALALRSLSRVTEPALVEATLNLVLEQRIPVGSYRYLLEPLLGAVRSGPAGFAWFSKNVDTLKQRLPAGLMRGAMIAALQRCARQQDHEVREFFERKLLGAQASDGVLEEALEATSQCVAFRERHAAGARTLWSAK
jgi:hypothetical protein